MRFLGLPQTSGCIATNLLQCFLSENSLSAENLPLLRIAASEHVGVAASMTACRFSGQPCIKRHLCSVVAPKTN